MTILTVLPTPVVTQPLQASSRGNRRRIHVFLSLVSMKWGMETLEALSLAKI